jgi:ribose-phosphate pyrophosphokinase
VREGRPASPETAEARTACGIELVTISFSISLSLRVLVGNVEGKTAILIDDMADTCGTLALAAKHLLAKARTACGIELVTISFSISLSLSTCIALPLKIPCVTLTVPLD